MTDIRRKFEKDLEKLKHLMIEMGNLVEESIEKAISALKSQDEQIAELIKKEDDAIDELEKKIERICLRLIARQQPVAKDLRIISSTLKIITDLERIADHSSDIADIILKMSKDNSIKPLIDIAKLGNLSKVMVQKAIDAYIKQDINIALDVCSSDDEVDDLFYKVIMELMNLMKDDTSKIDHGINYMFITKYLERMGDHATNIAEWVVYNITGKHEHLAKYLHTNESKSSEKSEKVIKKIMKEVENDNKENK